MEVATRGRSAVAPDGRPVDGYGPERVCGAETQEMRTGTWILSVLALSIAALTLAACDESEQDRILRYEKGTYLGPADPPLTPEQLDDLRYRTKLQGGS